MSLGCAFTEAESSELADTVHRKVSKKPGSVGQIELLQMQSYPKFHNEIGVPIVRVGCREFECIGDKPPQDHPHINMGDADEIVCPYCSTLFRFDPNLSAHEAEPAPSSRSRGMAGNGSCAGDQWCLCRIRSSSNRSRFGPPWQQTGPPPSSGRLVPHFISR